MAVVGHAAVRSRVMGENYKRAMPALRLKLADRGVLRPGAKADLVLFDPARIVDRSTFAAPKALSEGIRLVLVNGEAVWEDGKATGRRPGRVLVSAGTADAAPSPR
ncbi:MAG: amidohydrolase family protein [Acidobacteria bacterium]|nr:amidohydrolase family protein [Acidobacteriota bacterium]MCA1612068.1 amidohydrolase family protein [Acidobacteriota bacterium]